MRFGGPRRTVCAGFLSRSLLQFYAQLPRYPGATAELIPDRPASGAFEGLREKAWRLKGRTGESRAARSRENYTPGGIKLFARMRTGLGALADKSKMRKAGV